MALSYFATGISLIAITISLIVLYRLNNIKRPLPNTIIKHKISPINVNRVPSMYRGPMAAKVIWMPSESIKQTCCTVKMIDTAEEFFFHYHSVGLTFFTDLHIGQVVYIRFKHSMSLRKYLIDRVYI